jgi:hypothetical protein
VRLTGQPNSTIALTPWRHDAVVTAEPLLKAMTVGAFVPASAWRSTICSSGRVDDRPVPALGLVLPRQTQEQHHDISGGRCISCGSNEHRIGRRGVEGVAGGELDAGTERLSSSGQGLQPADHSRWVDRRAAGSLVSGGAGQLADDGQALGCLQVQGKGAVVNKQHG